MLRSGFVLWLALALLSAGCGCGSHNNYMTGSGMLHITQLMPASAMAGTAFVLTVNGTGFGTDSIVYWGTMALATTYVTTIQVTADITAAETANTGTVQVYVHSGGANSNAVAFTVD